MRIKITYNKVKNLRIQNLTFLAWLYLPQLLQLSSTLPISATRPTLSTIPTLPTFSNSPPPSSFSNRIVASNRKWGKGCVMQESEHHFGCIWEHGKITLRGNIREYFAKLQRAPILRLKISNDRS